MTYKEGVEGWSGYTAYGAPFGDYKSYFGSGGNRVSFGDNGEHPYSWSYKIARSRVFLRRIAPGVTVQDSTWSCWPQYHFGTYPTNEAVAKVWDRLTQSDFNAGVFAGEFRETVDFIADSVRRIALSVAAARRGQFAQAASALAGRRKQSLPSTLGSNWLTYKYALMPLLADIKAAYEFLTKEHQVVKRVRATSKKQDPDNKDANESNNGLSWSYRGHSLAQVRGIVDYQVSLADRLGLTDPLSIAWELTKLSFVIDWLLPVGNFLAAVNARNKVRFVPGTLWVTRAIREHWNAPKPYGKDIIWNPDCAADYVERAIGDRWSLDALPVKLPTFVSPLGQSYDRYLSATALLGQALRSR